jgi:small subunit ribosomal protein S2
LTRAEKKGEREAREGLVDTNADPSDIDYIIPGNDDAIKGIQLILEYMVAAVEEGKNSKAKKEEK